MRLQFAPYMLKFKEPAGTSRGILNEKITCIMRLYDEAAPEVCGIGEAAIFPGLSPEADERFFYKLMELQANVRLGKMTDLSHFPSLQCGFEMAIRDFASGGKGLYYDSDWICGKTAMTINGLIWMGTFEEMSHRLENKLAQGFKCIKIKVGAIDFDEELRLIKYIREHHTKEEVAIRLDANGGFSLDNAMERLEVLAKYDIESIEQPIKAGNYEAMARLCADSPISVALDEELIGLFTADARKKMLEEIAPQYIVLKPSLIGGFSSAQEWMELAREYNTGYWITSSLESNIGLNALAQWVATLEPKMPQGLGTGALFTNNFETPVYTEGQYIKYNPALKLCNSRFDNLDWRE